MKTTATDDGLTTWHFTKAELVALLAHMSSDATRSSQYGLVLDSDLPSHSGSPGTDSRLCARAHATDGHRCAAVTTADRVGADRAVKRGPTIVDRALLERAVKVAGAKDDIRIILHEKDALIEFGGNALGAPLTDATPNSIEFLATSPSGCASQAFNGGYLADLAAVSKAVPPSTRVGFRGEKVYPGITLFPGAGELDPMVAKIQSPETQCLWEIFLMPMRK